ncbi:MAG TPA: transposase [Candidatus Nanopelagicaceae bacterium]|nr:transposase [Candidatus Nanopelagicaceae bacterium]
MRQAVAALPKGTKRPRVRCDSGLFSGDGAWAAVDAEADFAIAAARNAAVCRAIQGIPKDAWRPATGMRGAAVAVADYVPEDWPKDTRMIVRRVRIEANEISQDPRSRRRRTFDPAQLQLALEGAVSHAYAYYPIVTNLKGPAQAIEAWFRERAQIEERIKDTKLGMALRHLPSGFAVANQVWMWAAFLALTLSAALQALSGNDHPHRAHGKRLRRELIGVPARVVRHARRLVGRLAPAQQDGPFLAAYQLLGALPTPTG